LGIFFNLVDEEYDETVFDADHNPFTEVDGSS
jgi:hypothetical protein